MKTLTLRWGPHNPGTNLTADPEEAKEAGAVLVNEDRMRILEERGHFAVPKPEPESPAKPTTAPPQPAEEKTVPSTAAGRRLGHVAPREVSDAE